MLSGLASMDFFILYLMPCCYTHTSTQLAMWHFPYLVFVCLQLNKVSVSIFVCVIVCVTFHIITSMLSVSELQCCVLTDWKHLLLLRFTIKVAVWLGADDLDLQFHGYVSGIRDVANGGGGWRWKVFFHSRTAIIRLVKISKFFFQNMQNAIVMYLTKEMFK